ncbi:MAG: MFS transporter [bacterium]
MAKPTKPISIGYAWYALFVMFMINLVNYLDRLSIGPAMEHIKRDFVVTDAKMGLIAGSFMMVYAIVSLPMGLVSDRTKFGRTKVVALGAAVWCVATTCSGFAKSFWQFFFLRSSVGSGEGIYAPSGTAIITDYFPAAKRNIAISIFMSAMVVGGAIAMVIAGVILDKTDRFDLKKMSSLAPYKINETVNGWQYKGLGETKEKKAEFRFTSPENGAALSLVMSKPKLPKPAKPAGAFTKFVKSVLSLVHIKPKPSKPADAYTKLFNVDFKVADKSGDRKPTPAEKTAAQAIVKGIGTLEGAQLKETRQALATWPAHLKKQIPKKYKNIFFYDREKKELVFHGPMTKQDKIELMLISDNAQYANSLIELFNQSNFNYRRSDNWRWIFWILGPPGLLFAFMAFFLREPVKGGTETYLTEDEAKQIDAAARPSIWELAKNKSVVLMILGNILVTFCVGALTIWIFPFVERFKNMDSSEAAMKVGPVVILFTVAGVILSGLFADKLFKKTKRANNIIMVVSILAGIPFMYGFLYSNNYIIMVGSVSLCMFFLSMINGPQNALLMSLIEPKLRATLNAVHILLIHVLGDAISPFIVGYYSDKYNLQFALAVLPVFLVLGCILFAAAGYFVPGDLKALEQRMRKQLA